VDPDDGFDVLCEKLEVILCDKDQVPRDNPYAVSSDPLSCHAMPCTAVKFLCYKDSAFFYVSHTVVRIYHLAKFLRSISDL